MIANNDIAVCLILFGFDVLIDGKFNCSRLKVVEIFFVLGLTLLVSMKHDVNFFTLLDVFHEGRIIKRKL